MFTFLLVVHAIIAALLVAVILMQKSEGGGLTTGGSPSGLMSARGAADFLTRATATLATLFIVMSIVLAVMASTRGTSTIDPNSIKPVAPGAQPAPRSAPGEGPLSGGTGVGPFSGAAGVAAGNESAPATGGNSSVPLAQ
ncbi:preprotein translocase subunit SecG [Sphingomonas aracearum]|uniref:Protein-export membrane protein SecG n=1 Tax=Sphingomonas aracearum TaxID=2283317 RepID=A0A369VVI4_9SPHN|nr:preprotein translocase subunit SecG [Sphingomonas aracearum]RDE06093.1 preprotein translocase subunit SecG [Sphingomonas aracearum]